MMLLPIFISLLLQFGFTNAVTVDKYGISLQDKMERMERMLLAGTNVEVSVNPCSFFRTGNPNSGEQTAAEWMRIVFHDAITADLAAGIGGLDASIGFESNRDENVGLHFINDTIGIFATGFSVYTSMADVIALGLTTTLISCDPIPRILKIRVGREDAIAAGPSGVPKPTDDLATTLAAFSKAGFSQEEAIGSVACGHSLGAVHHANFPDIVEASAVTSTNFDGGLTFDSTTAVFDNTNVLEYLNGTGKGGGPLVIGFNSTTNSDLRLFESDSNATVEALTDSQKFQDTCYALFEKMLDTVPGSVTLSDVVVPRAWILQEGYLDISTSGTLFFVGSFTFHSLAGVVPSSAVYSYTTDGGVSTGTLSTGIGASSLKHGYGTVTKFQFNDTISNTAVSGLSLAEGTYTASINLNLFIIRGKTFLGGSIAGGLMYIVRAALLTTLITNSSIPTTTIYLPIPQKGTLSPTITTRTANMTILTTSGDYTIFQGVLSMGTVTAAGDKFIDVKLGEEMSPKLPGSNFGSCTNTDLLTC